MDRLKRVLRAIGVSTLAVLALTGLLTVTRGTPLRHVVYSLGGRTAQVSDSAFRDLVGLYSGIQFEAGNQVEQLVNGDGTYPLLWRDLRGARETITIQNYYSKPGAVADTLAVILKERARAGVRVLLLLDAFGSQSLRKSWADDLRRSGVEIALLRKLKWYSLRKASERSHVRAFVIDGRIGYTGGFGLADYWLGDGHTKDQWRESNVRFLGPAVMGLQAAFASGWVEATGELLAGHPYFPPQPPTGRMTAGVLFTAPTTGSTHAERFLALTIAGAARTLYIANSYFVPDDDFRDLLNAAAKRGVDVRILTPSKVSDVLTTWYAGRARYETLLRSGIRIYEYPVTMMHAKTLVADGFWGTIGSLNFDNRSLVFNNESNLVVWDGDFGARMDSTFLEDVRISHEVMLPEFQKRPWTERMVEMAASVFQRLL